MEKRLIGLFCKVDEHDIVCVHETETHRSDCVLDDFTLGVARDEHPCLWIVTLLAFMIGSLVCMWLFVLPITEFNRDHSVLVMVFNKFDWLLHVLNREQNKLSLLVAHYTVVRSELVNIDTRDSISEELLAIGLERPHQLTTFSIDH